jgi:PAS domain-containing protein
MTGYSAEDAQGRNCRFLQGADTSDAQIDKLRETIGVNGEDRLEMLNYRKDGSRGRTAAGQGVGRTGQPRQERIPRQHES